MKIVLKNFFVICGLISIYCLMPGLSFSAEKSWKLLPSRTLFAPLIADLREPQTGFFTLVNKNRYAGAIGQSIDLFQWKLSNKERISWGVHGAAYALLDYGGRSFPMRANDWQYGTSISHSKKKFSQRLEFTHASAHLGDSLTDERNWIEYSREYFRLILSYDYNDSMRFYGGGGAVVHTFPHVNPIFFQGGGEVFSSSKDFLSHPIRFYGAYDVKYKDEAGGAWNNSVQFGIQWKPSRKQTRKALRLGIHYFNGNNEFGQFYLEKDSYWGFGIYFDS